MDLFDYALTTNHVPLAERMRPLSLDDFIGQKHILGKGTLLRKLIETDSVSSMILQGPPASGKTSLASIISKTTNAEFVRLNAVSLSTSELKVVIESAKDRLKFYSKKTIVFIDEIHAMRSNVQMLLLPVIEDGTIILNGATTESVMHDIIPPLASRCRVYRLNPLSSEDVKKIIEHSIIDPERGLGLQNIKIAEEALKYLIDVCNGDVRSSLNALEIASQTSNEITLEMIQDAYQFRLNGITTTDFYDLISAFIKSVRASETNSALYWLARMLHSGVDPLVIARRMVISASEDIGLAYPQCLQLAMAAKQAVEFIGMPEARIPLAEAVIFLCESPKSNSAYKAINAAIQTVETTRAFDVPGHLKNSTGQYINPIDFPESHLEYMPRELQQISFYKPQNSGIEEKIFKKYFSNNK
jgi:putative ATPase